MQIKLKKIIDSVDSLKTLQATKFPIKVSYRIKRIVDKIDGILKTFNEKRNELIEQYGTENPETKQKEVVEEQKLKDFLRDLNELLEVEEVIDIEPISINELGETVIEPKYLVDFIFTD